jgi:hypothetical protein
MKFLKELVCVAVIAVAVGCASNGWKADTTPYPRTTPYDANEFMRSAYRDGFARGYRAEMNTGISNVETPYGLYPAAEQQGYYAGVAQARVEKEKQK